MLHHQLNETEIIRRILNTMTPAVTVLSSKKD